MKKILTILLLLCPTLTQAEMMLGEWLEINEPKVIDYLASISDQNKGHKILGIELNDGMKLLNGASYLGNIVNLENKTNIYLFSTKEFGIEAYIWVQAGGIKFTLPDCAGTDPREEWPGWSRAVISGDVYTYPEVYPGQNIVVTHCVPDTWLKNIK